LRIPQRAWNPKAWNSDCAPRPIKAMTSESGRASRRATSAEVASVATWPRYTQRARHGCLRVGHRDV
jgi:hypothetical protein